MKSVLIVENAKNSLTVNENAQTGTKKEYNLSGTFTEFGKLNRNERIYTADKFLPALNELNERISSLGVVYGEFDHPDVFDTSLSRSSHIIKKAEYVKENDSVFGEIRLLSTYWGKEAKALVDDGVPIFVSSRAAGITESDGTVTLKKLFTYDIVADPGFASAKLQSINESFGFKSDNNTNFRIYEMSDESKINDLFTMNKSDFITKQQMVDYSKYLVNELASTKKMVSEAITKGDLSPEKLEKLLEYYEDLNKSNGQVVKYLDYLADKIQVVVNENKSLKDTQTKLIKHNDYLAENLEKAITYTEYLAENLDKNISYSEYLAENLDKNIEYSEYLAENLDKNIAYAEYIAENLDKNIEYSEYIAEHLDNTIAYSEYLAENLEGNIAYSEYLAENLDDNIAYGEYLAENLDKNINYSGLIAERLNSGKLFESMGDVAIPSLEDHGFSTYSEEEESPVAELEAPEGEEAHEEEEEKIISDIKALNDEENALLDKLAEEEKEEESHEEGEELAPVTDETPADAIVAEEEKEEEFVGESDTELSLQIDKLISEAKKRKASENTDLHFLKFLNKAQVDGYYSLTNEEQESVKLYISERSYFSSSDVLKMINEALSVKNESIEEKLIRLMPESVKKSWDELNESSQKSMLSQSKLFPDLSTEQKIEHFWLTRNFKKNESTKKLVNESLIQEDRLSDNEMKSILERFKNL